MGIVTGQCVICAQKGVDPDQTHSGKNKTYNKLSSVELAIGQLIQLCLVCVGEFLVCMQFSEEKKNKKKEKKKQSDPDQTLYSVSSAELAQKVVRLSLDKSI